ncbi:MAG: penicillin-binding protein, partial [Abditibacteriota bacterium]|nr:penicillin-binding protein [Abditibacteriota bacterium]
MASTTPSPSTAGATVSPRSAASAAGAGKRASTRRYPHSFWWYVKWFFISLQVLIFCAIIATVCIGKGLYDQLNKIVPDTRFITSRNKAEPTRVYAADGTLLAEFRGDQREWIPISDLKVKRQRNGKNRTELGNLARATLAIEDARFYKHPGMDAYRIVGAAVANVRNPDGIQQGGSTITEQLAVNVYLTRTKTLARRLQTALLALQLEKRFSKDEILELYLNEIYYGNRAYGCEAAARTYFGKAAKDLNIAQAAFIAGLPQQPGRLDPFEEETFPRAKKRQRLVLKAMLEKEKQQLGVGINWSQYQQAIKDDSIHTQVLRAKARHLAERRRIKEWRSPYFVAYVKQYLQKQYHWTDEFLSKSGLKIYTTLDPKIQAAAEKAMNRRLDSLGQSKLQGALVCIDPWSGHVVAMYGGRDYYDKKTGQFNRATQARRQPGSTFKPYVYATAMEMGYTPSTIVDDRPIKINGWSPKNYDFRHRGKMQFRTALAVSNNVAATRILMKVGVQNVIEKAHLMGIESPLVPYPSLALGSSEISLLENTSAFGVFATRGLRAEATPVKRVINYAGEVLMEQPTPVYGARVMTEEAGDRMWDMLRYVVTNGTGENAAIRGVDVIGKTGTTSNNHDVWFMGATRKLTCGVWMGLDKPKELYGSAGGSWCA